MYPEQNSFHKESKNWYLEETEIHLDQKNNDK